MPKSRQRSFKLPKIILIFISLISLLFPISVSAHEAYVLTQQEFAQGLKTFSPNPFAPLISPDYIYISVIIMSSTILAYVLVFLWATTKPAYLLDKWIRRASVFGPVIVRIAISTSFFYAAFSNDILGPELQLRMLPLGFVIRFLEFLMGLMFLFGVLVELAAFIGILIFIYLCFYFRDYMLTYANYFGELCLLVLFGLRLFSFDGFFLGKKSWWGSIGRIKKYEVPILRVLYGIGLVYAGYSIKFLHQAISVAVYNQYHLQDFFHAKAQFIAAGAGLSEILIGLLIILGFGMRLTILISLVFITLSLLYFQELIWPHLMLYGISFALIINSSDFLTIDHYFVPWLRKLLGIRISES